MQLTVPGVEYYIIANLQIRKSNNIIYNPL